MVKRRPHLLVTLKRKFRPEYHIFVDIETHVGKPIEDRSTHTFRLGWALFWRRRTDGGKDTEEWYKITDPRTFWEWVEGSFKGNNRLILVAHNVEYDTFILRAFDILPEMGWELTNWYSGNQVSIYRWRKGKRSIQFVDNCNWFKGPLASWGEVVGYPKLDVDPLTANDDELDPYCKRDVEILHELWKWYYQFIDEHDLGSWGITIPSQAFIAYRQRFMDYDIFIHDDYDVLRLEREAYHGGRSEVFRRGEFEGGPFYKLDVNSMYPWAMRGHDYPTSLRGHSENVSLKSLRYFLKKYCVIAEVTLFIDKPFFPTVQDDRLVYKVGKVRTVLSTPELELALKNGWIEKVHRASWYRKAPIFKRYVDYFYSLKTQYKEEGNEVCEELTKLMLNSLYGKFGQRKTTIKTIGECAIHEFSTIHVYSMETGKHSIEYRFGGKVWLSTRGGESYHSFPAVAAHVTAYARIQLYKMVESVGRENVFYVDTDSMIVNEKARVQLDPWIQEGHLGMLKEEQVATQFAIFTPKDYIIDGERVIKGIPKNAVQLAPNVFQQEQFPGIRSLLRDGDSKVYVTKRITKTLKREIKSGWIDDEGFIHPWGSVDPNTGLTRSPPVKGE